MDENVLFECVLVNLNLISINQRHENNPAYYMCKDHLRELLRIKKKELEGFKKITEKCEMSIVLNTMKDIDNCDKMIQDALEEAGIIDNDFLVVAKHEYVLRPLLQPRKEAIHIQLKSLSKAANGVIRQSITTFREAYEDMEVFT